MRELRANARPAAAAVTATRVLVIDDSPSVFHSIKAALADEGYVIERLGCFVDLPSKIKDNPPDLIMLDLQIPELPGLAMGKYIRRHEVRHIPILIYSSAPLKELQRAVIEIGAEGAVPKDTPPEALRTRVKKALAGRR